MEEVEAGDYMKLFNEDSEEYMIVSASQNMKINNVRLIE